MPKVKTRREKVVTSVETAEQPDAEARYGTRALVAETSPSAMKAKRPAGGRYMTRDLRAIR